MLPSGGGGFGTRKNLIVVAKQGGNYNTITGALNSISDNTNTNPYDIYIDPGIYTEDVTTKEYVNLNGPSASIIGNMILVDNVTVTINNISSTSGVVVTKSGTGYSVLTANNITVPDSGIGLLNLNVSSILFAQIMRIFVGESAIGVGDGSSGFGHTHLHIHDIYFTGDSGVGIATLGSKNIIGHIDHILELDPVTSSTGIAVFADGIVKLSVNEIIADTVYNVVSTGTLNLTVGSLTGTRTQAGGANVRENGMPTTNPGVGFIWTNDGVPTIGS